LLGEHGGSKKRKDRPGLSFLHIFKMNLLLFNRFQPDDGNTFVIFGDFLDLFKFMLIFGPPDVKN
jgi:hypothetical protein